MASWDRSASVIGGFFPGGGGRGGSLKVVTTKMKPGYLRRNGVPYSADAVVTEYFDRFDVPNGDSLLVVSTEIVDPTYLAQPYWTSTPFQETGRRRRLESYTLRGPLTGLDLYEAPTRHLQCRRCIMRGPDVRRRRQPGASAGLSDTLAPGFDISGYWTSPLQEDATERGAGPELGDYGGFPINEAARLFALSYDASRVTLRHHQCDGYVAPYSIRSIGNARAWEERDPHTQRLIAIHWYNQTFEGHRTIWMDGRPHPPAWAPHTWMGFSTGRFVGQALEVQTTHLKQGWLRRNGLPESDQATVVEFFVRHGDHLTHTSVISDPVYLAEPEVRSTDFARQPIDHQTWLFACDDGEQILDRAPDRVPNYAFGENPFVGRGPRPATRFRWPRISADRRPRPPTWRQSSRR